MQSRVTPPTLCKERKEWGTRILGCFVRKGLGRL
jgi:hypothetical protein